MLNFVVNDIVLFDPPEKYKNRFKSAREFCNHYKAVILEKNNKLYLQTLYKNGVLGPTLLLEDIEGTCFIVKIEDFIPIFGRFIESTEKGKPWGVPYLNEDGIIPDKFVPGAVQSVVSGYYYDSKFYKDIEHTQLITPSKNIIYIDLTNPEPIFYIWDDVQNKYVTTSVGATAGVSVSVKADESINGENSEASTQADINKEVVEALLSAERKVACEIDIYPAVSILEKDIRGVVTPGFETLILTINKGIVDIYTIDLYQNGTNIKTWSGSSIKSGGSFTYDVGEISAETTFKVKVTDMRYKETVKELTIPAVLPSYFGTEDNLEKHLLDDPNKEFEITLNDEQIIYKYPKTLGKLDGISSRTADGNSYGELIHAYTLDESDANYFIYTLGNKITIDDYKIKFIKK